MVNSNVRKLFRVLEWVGYLALVVIIAVLLLPLLPTEQKLSSYVIVSGSMEPTIKMGSVSVVQKVDVVDINVGDIIAFKSPENAETTIVHRLVDKKGEEFVTRGDNNNSADNWVLTADKIQGRVMFSIPYVGFASLYVRTIKGFVILIGVPALLLVIMQIKKIMEGIEEEVQKRASSKLAEKPRDMVSSII